MFNMIDKICRISNSQIENNNNNHQNDLCYSNNDDPKISMAWRNLRFQVRQYGIEIVGQKKIILDRLNGSFKANSLNGLMGPSGSGKTTLLNCLSGNENYRSGLAKESEIYLNSLEKQNPNSIYIIQNVNECITQRMSVGDIFRYAFKFKNNHSKIDYMSEHIEDVMKELMLPLNLLNRYFVDCSGGEQKRIAIGQELMALEKPSFLFIDEPTTGLDSTAALEVATCLSQLTKKHQITVIASIHAPNNEILGLFDQLYVLSKGGVCIYSGPPESIHSNLQAVTEGRLIVPKDQPPIEILIQLACTGLEDENVLKLAQTTLIQEHEAIVTQLGSLTLLPNGLPNRRKLFRIADLKTNLQRTFQTTFISNFNFCLQATLLYIAFFVLMSTLFDHKMALSSGCASLVGAFGTNCTTQLEDESLYRENFQYLSFTMLYVGLVMAAIGCTVFSSNLRIFRSEHRNQWYSLSVYYWSSTLVALLELTVYCAIITICAYFLSFQHSIDNYSINYRRFGLFLLFMWLLCAYVQSFVQLIGTILVGHPHLITVVYSMLYTFANMMGGFFVDLERGGKVFRIMVSNIIGLKFISKGMIYSIYGIDRCDAETEYSVVLKHFYVDPEQVDYYILRSVVIILILRFIAVIVMFVKFSNIFTKSTNFLNSEIQTPNNKQMILLDLNSKPDSKIQIENKANDNKTSNSIIQVEVQEQTFKGFTMLAWRDLTLFESSSIYEQFGMDSNINENMTKQKTILHSLNGDFKIGTLNAIMGTSGAGKTSLLKVLNGQNKSRLSDSTCIYLSRFTKISTCFITQEVSDHLWSGLTAKQFLIYASRLKNIATCEVQDKQIDHEVIALNVLVELDLMGTVDTELDQCSGGERKRLALAAELTSIVMPNLVCIDEPTSGLDSNSAESVISCICKLAHLHSITVIASIHQPNSSILSMFDQLYVLARGGVCIYSGPPNQVQSQLAKLNTETNKPNYPIDELVKHSCNDHHNSVVQKLLQLTNEHFNENFNKIQNQTQLTVDGVQHNRRRFSISSTVNLFLRYFAYFRGHLWKESVFYFFNYLIYGIMLKRFYDKNMIYVTGCINLEDDFNRTCANEEQIDQSYHLTSNVKYTYFYVSFFFFFLLLQTGLSMLRDLRLFKNEHHNGWYSTGSFYLTKCIFESIQLFPLITAYVYICNWHEDVRPGIYWNITRLLLLSAIAYQGMGHVCALLCQNNITILSLGCTSIFLFFTLLSNVFLSYSHLHYFYQFVSNLSISRFIFEATILLQYGFGRCGPREIQATLHVMSLTDDDYYHCVVMLVFNLVLYRVVALYLLVRMANPVENRRNRAERIWASENKCSNSNSVGGLGVSFYQFKITQIRV